MSFNYVYDEATKALKQVPRLKHIDNPKDKRVEQHHRDNCLPRNIVAKAAEQNILSHLVTQPSFYVDDTIEPDLRTKHQIFIDARNALSELPVAVQNRFKSARDLISFLGDENNREEAIRLGLVTKKDPPAPSDTDRIIEAIKTTPTAKAEGGKGGAL